MNESIDKSKRCQELFDVGDYKQARRMAKGILKNDESSADSIETAQRILRATGTDAAAVSVFVFTLALLAYLVVKFIVL